MVAYGKLADKIVNGANRGELVIVEGRLRQERWQTEEGENRSRMTFTRNRFIFFCMASLATGGETIYYVSDVKYFSRLKSEKYSSKKDMVSAHILYLPNISNRSLRNKHRMRIYNKIRYWRMRT